MKNEASVIGRKRIPVPDGMTDMQKSVWISMVNSCSAEHFIESDIPLMISYVRIIIQVHRAMGEMEINPMTYVADNGKPAPHPIIQVHKSLSGTLSNLAMRLRLCPSTRIQITNKAVGSDKHPDLVTKGDDLDQLFAH